MSVIERFRYGNVTLPITPECLADAHQDTLVRVTERWVDDWCADNGVIRLEGPARWQPEEIDLDRLAVTFSALVWPAAIPHA